jgi:hypothetical protein
MRLRISAFVNAATSLVISRGQIANPQQTQKPRGNMSLSYARIRPRDEETHATRATRSGALVERLARIASIMDRKIFAPSALPSRTSEARSG